MNALSKLLTKVAKRVLTRNPSNDDLLQVADRVVLWSNANYISEQQVDEIASAVPEQFEVPEESSTVSEESEEPADEQQAESEGE